MDVAGRIPWTELIEPSLEQRPRKRLEVRSLPLGTNFR